MKLLTQAIIAKLRKNWDVAEREDGHDGSDLVPVVKFFTPDAAATWLITEMAPDGALFGLADLGLGFPELGYVDLEELKEVRGRLGLPVERDLYFKPTKTIGQYADEASAIGRIVT